jgi:hypothetical protein
MNSSSPIPSDRATAESDQVAEPSTVYRKYVAGSAAAYQRYLRPVATRAADAYQRHVRPAAARAAAAAATAAYRKYVESSRAAQVVGPSTAERAAAAAAESAAAYEKYVRKPAV